LAKKNSGKLRDVGILILRVGLGVMFIFHGWPKISGGPQVWEAVGGAVSAMGIKFGFVRVYGSRF